MGILNIKKNTKKKKVKNDTPSNSATKGLEKYIKSSVGEEEKTSTKSTKKKTETSTKSSLPSTNKTYEKWLKTKSEVADEKVKKTVKTSKATNLEKSNSGANANKSKVTVQGKYRQVQADLVNGKKKLDIYNQKKAQTYDLTDFHSDDTIDYFSTLAGKSVLDENDKAELKTARDSIRSLQNTYPLSGDLTAEQNRKLTYLYDKIDDKLNESIISAREGFMNGITAGVYDFIQRQAKASTENASVIDKNGKDIVKEQQSIYDYDYSGAIANNKTANDVGNAIGSAILMFVTAGGGAGASVASSAVKEALKQSLKTGIQMGSISAVESATKIQTPLEWDNEQEKIKQRYEKQGKTYEKKEYDVSDQLVGVAINSLIGFATGMAGSSASSAVSNTVVKSILNNKNLTPTMRNWISNMITGESFMLGSSLTGSAITGEEITPENMAQTILTGAIFSSLGAVKNQIGLVSKEKMIKGLTEENAYLSEALENAQDIILNGTYTDEQGREITGAEAYFNELRNIIIETNAKGNADNAQINAKGNNSQNAYLIPELNEWMNSITSAESGAKEAFTGMFDSMIMKMQNGVANADTFARLNNGDVTLLRNKLREIEVIRENLEDYTLAGYTTDIEGETTNAEKVSYLEALESVLKKRISDYENINNGKKEKLYLNESSGIDLTDIVDIETAYRENTTESEVLNNTDFMGGESHSETQHYMTRGEALQTAENLTREMFLHQTGRLDLSDFDEASLRMLLNPDNADNFAKLYGLNISSNMTPQEILDEVRGEEDSNVERVEEKQEEYDLSADAELEKTSGKKSSELTEEERKSDKEIRQRNSIRRLRKSISGLSKEKQELYKRSREKYSEFFDNAEVGDTIEDEDGKVIGKITNVDDKNGIVYIQYYDANGEFDSMEIVLPETLEERSRFIDSGDNFIENEGWHLVKNKNQVEVHASEVIPANSNIAYFPIGTEATDESITEALKTRKVVMIDLGNNTDAEFSIQRLNGKPVLVTNIDEQGNYVDSLEYLNVVTDKNISTMSLYDEVKRRIALMNNKTYEPAQTSLKSSLKTESKANNYLQLDRNATFNSYVQQELANGRTLLIDAGTNTETYTIKQGKEKGKTKQFRNKIDAEFRIETDNDGKQYLITNVDKDGHVVTDNYMQVAGPDIYYLVETAKRRYEKMISAPVAESLETKTHYEHLDEIDEMIFDVLDKGKSIGIRGYMFKIVHAKGGGYNLVVSKSGKSSEKNFKTKKDAFKYLSSLEMYKDYQKAFSEEMSRRQKKKHNTVTTIKNGKKTVKEIDWEEANQERREIDQKLSEQKGSVLGEDNTVVDRPEEINDIIDEYERDRDFELRKKEIKARSIAMDERSRTGKMTTMEPEDVKSEQEKIDKSCDEFKAIISDFNDRNMLSKGESGAKIKLKLTKENKLIINEIITEFNSSKTFVNSGGENISLNTDLQEINDVLVFMATHKDSEGYSVLPYNTVDGWSKLNRKVIAKEYEAYFNIPVYDEYSLGEYEEPYYLYYQTAQNGEKLINKIPIISFDEMLEDRIENSLQTKKIISRVISKANLNHKKKQYFIDKYGTRYIEFNEIDIKDLYNNGLKELVEPFLKKLADTGFTVHFSYGPIEKFDNLFKVYSTTGLVNYNLKKIFISLVANESRLNENIVPIDIVSILSHEIGHINPNEDVNSFVFDTFLSGEEKNFIIDYYKLTHNLVISKDNRDFYEVALGEFIADTRGNYLRGFSETEAENYYKDEAIKKGRNFSEESERIYLLQQKIKNILDFTDGSPKKVFISSSDIKSKNGGYVSYVKDILNLMHLNFQEILSNDYNVNLKDIISFASKNGIIFNKQKGDWKKQNKSFNYNMKVLSNESDYGIFFISQYDTITRKSLKSYLESGKKAIVFEFHFTEFSKPDKNNKTNRPTFTISFYDKGEKINGERWDLYNWTNSRRSYLHDTRGNSYKNSKAESGIRFNELSGESGRNARLESTEEPKSRADKLPVREKKEGEVFNTYRRESGKYYIAIHESLNNENGLKQIALDYLNAMYINLSSKELIEKSSNKVLLDKIKKKINDKLKVARIDRENGKLVLKDPYLTFKEGKTIKLDISPYVQITTPAESLGEQDSTMTEEEWDKFVNGDKSDVEKLRKERKENVIRRLSFGVQDLESEKADLENEIKELNKQHEKTHDSGTLYHELRRIMNSIPITENSLDEGISDEGMITIVDDAGNLNMAHLSICIKNAIERSHQQDVKSYLTSILNKKYIFDNRERTVDIHSIRTKDLFSLVRDLQNVSHILRREHFVWDRTYKKWIHEKELQTPFIKDVETSPLKYVFKNNIVRDFFKTFSIDLRTEMQKLTGFAKDSRVVKLVDELNEAEIDANALIQRCEEILNQAIKDNKINTKEFFNKKFEFKHIKGTKNGEEVSFSASEAFILTLASLCRQKDILVKALTVGFVLPDFELYAKGKFNESFKEENRSHFVLTREELQEIFSVLSKGALSLSATGRKILKMFVPKLNGVQRQVPSKELVESDVYLSSHTTASIDKKDTDTNDDLLGEDFYDFTTDIVSERNLISRRDSGENAEYPLLVMDYLTVLKRYYSTASKYVNMYEPLNEFARIFDSKAVQTAIEQNYNRHDVEYVEKIIKQLNHSGYNEKTFVTVLKNNFSFAMLAGNISGILKQLPSTFAGAIRIGFAPILKAMMSNTQGAKLLKKLGIKGIKRYSAKEVDEKENVFYIRSKSYQDVAMESLSHTKNPVLKAISTVLMRPYRFFDRLATKILYPATEYYVDDLIKQGKISEEQREEYIHSIYNYLLGYTQPSSLKTTLAPLLRTGNPFLDSIFIFCNQRFKYFARWIESILELKATKARYGKDSEEYKEASQKARRTAMSTVIVSALITAIGMSQTWLKKKDDDWYNDDGTLNAESVLSTFFSGTAESIISNIPLGSSITNIVHNIVSDSYSQYDIISIPQIQMITDVKDSIADLCDLVNKVNTGDAELDDFYSTAMRCAKTVAEFFGVPLDIMEKYIVGICSRLDDIFHFSNGNIKEWYDSLYYGTDISLVKEAKGDKNTKAELLTYTDTKMKGFSGSDGYSLLENAVLWAKNMNISYGTDYGDDGYYNINDLTISNCNQIVDKETGVTHTLNATEQAEYREYANYAYNKAMLALSQSALFKRMSSEQKFTTISNVAMYAESYGKTRFCEKYGITIDKYVSVGVEEKGGNVTDFAMFQTLIRGVEGDNSTRRKMAILYNMNLSDKSTYAIYSSYFQNDNTDEVNTIEYAHSQGVSYRNFIKRQAQKMQEKADTEPSGESNYIWQDGKVVEVKQDDKAVEGSAKTKALKNILGSGYSEKEIAYFYNTEYPSDDTFAYAMQANIKASEYVKFVKNTIGVTSDYDENGKAITNSKRKKIAAIIEKLNISRIKKLMLMSAYNTHTYKLTNAEYKEIAEYINSLKISSSEKVKLADAFGLKTDGKIIYHSRKT